MVTNPSQPPIHSIRGAFKLFLVIFLCVGAVLAAAIAGVYRLQTQSHIDRLEGYEALAVKVKESIIEDIFQEITTDLQVLSELPALHAYLNQGQEKSLADVGKEYLILSRAKKDYDQIRFLDAKGMEIVRVDYNHGEPAIVPKARLQNKARRYFFADTFALGPDEVFVSPFDLNVERGQVERPLKPMIRFGVPIYDKQGKKRGIVLLNYLGARLLKRLERTGESMYGRPLLVNWDGYWLLGPQPDDAWGFMLEGRKGKTLLSRFPAAGPVIRDNIHGQVVTKEGMFSFSSVFPLKIYQWSSSGAGGAFAGNRERLASSQYHWKLISYVNRDALDQYSLSLLHNLSLLGAVLFLLTALASWFIAAAIVRKRLYRDELFNLAHFDTLTGLANRTLFFDRLNQTFETSRRHGHRFAILYVDLDDFKNVNDTMGHSAGDMLLKKVSKRMLNIVRRSDTVGRMGGDEFMLILTEITRPGDAELVAKKLLATLTRPVTLGNQQALVGACIGLAIFPDDSDDEDLLVKMADEAMYACKAAGKNAIRTAASLKPQS